MLQKSLFTKLRVDYQKHETERHQIIARANEVLHDSKRVIFSLHRGDTKTAASSLKDIERRVKELEKKFSVARLLDEGSYKAALEEYVEAKLFYQYCSKGAIEAIKEVKVGTESYLGGICDVFGELVRLATNQAAAGNVEEVQKIRDAAEDMMAELIDFDMTGYLRNKYDQAKGHIRRLEQVVYDIAIHQKK